MRVPREPITDGDSVICQPTGSKAPIIATIWAAEWHTGYGQWLFNKGDDGFYESQISYYYDTKSRKWKRYAI